jgi:hypothetical protein
VREAASGRTADLALRSLESARPLREESSCSWHLSIAMHDRDSVVTWPHRRCPSHLPASRTPLVPAGRTTPGPAVIDRASSVLGATFGVCRRRSRRPVALELARGREAQQRRADGACSELAGVIRHRRPKICQARDQQHPRGCDRARRRQEREASAPFSCDQRRCVAGPSAIRRSAAASSFRTSTSAQLPEPLPLRPLRTTIA